MVEARASMVPDRIRKLQAEAAARKGSRSRSPKKNSQSPKAQNRGAAAAAPAANNPMNEIMEMAANNAAKKRKK